MAPRMCLSSGEVDPGQGRPARLERPPPPPPRLRPCCGRDTTLGSGEPVDPGRRLHDWYRSTRAARDVIARPHPHPPASFQIRGELASTPWAAATCSGYYWNDKTLAFIRPPTCLRSASFFLSPQRTRHEFVVANLRSVFFLSFWFCFYQ